MSDSVTPWTAACQTSLSITNTWSLLKLMSIELVIPCDHLVLRCPLLLLPSIFPSIRVFSKESALRIRWPKYWRFSFNISPSNENPGQIRSEEHTSSLSITNFRSLLQLMSIKSVMPSNHLILCHPLLLLPSIFPSIRGFSNESVLHIRWPKYWSFSISPSSE